MEAKTLTVTLKFRDENIPSIHVDCKTIEMAQAEGYRLLKQFAGVSALWVDANEDRMVFDPTGQYLFTIIQGAKKPDGMEEVWKTNCALC
jgi:hypothetical protein